VDQALQAEHSEEIEALAAKEQQRRLRKQAKTGQMEVWAYERSCQRYTQVREALPEPDPVRFRNREALTEIVNAIVRDGLPIDDASIRPLATPLTIYRRLRQ